MKIIIIFMLTLISCSKPEKLELGNFILPIRENYEITGRFDKTDNIQIYEITNEGTLTFVEFREITYPTTSFQDYQTEEDYVKSKLWLIFLRGGLVNDSKPASVANFPHLEVKSVSKNKNDNYSAVLSHKDSVFSAVINIPEYSRGYIREIDTVNGFIRQQYYYKITDNVSRKMKLDIIDTESYDKIKKTYKQISISTRDYNLKSKKKIDEICNSISYK